MTHTPAKVMIERLVQRDADTIFGIPGDGNNGIMEALRKVKDKLPLIQVPQEEAAALMDRASAKFTGRVGVCLAASGPGAIHLLNGLYDAKLDSTPVLAACRAHASSRKSICCSYSAAPPISSSRSWAPIMRKSAAPSRTSRTIQT